MCVYSDNSFPYVIKYESGLLVSGLPRTEYVHISLFAVTLLLQTSANARLIHCQWQPNIICCTQYWLEEWSQRDQMKQSGVSIIAICVKVAIFFMFPISKAPWNRGGRSKYKKDKINQQTIQSEARSQWPLVTTVTKDNCYKDNCL